MTSVEDRSICPKKEEEETSAVVVPCFNDASPPLGKAFSLNNNDGDDFQTREHGNNKADGED